MKRTERRRMHPALKILLAVILISVIVFAGLIAYVYFQLKGTTGQVFDDDFSNATSELRETDVSFRNGDPISVVLFGTDDDQERNESGMGQRSDTIMVVTLNPNTDEGRIVSIPRDTRAEIAERGTVEKINHAYAYGGPEMAKRTVENFLDLPIDHFVSINMDGFTTIIDEIGGITITSQDTFEQSGYQFTAGETYEMDGDMLEAVAKLARNYNLPCQVSLEEYMACAVGGCAGCVVEVQTDDGPAMRRVCVDGPVFDAQSVFQ